MKKRYLIAMGTLVVIGGMIGKYLLADDNPEILEIEKIKIDDHKPVISELEQKITKKHKEIKKEEEKKSDNKKKTLPMSKSLSEIINEAYLENYSPGSNTKKLN